MGTERPDCLTYHRESNNIRRIGSTVIRSVVSGAGQEKARRATEKLCTQFQPDIIVASGFCGGIDLRCVIGSIVLANIVSSDEGEISLESKQLEEIKNCLDSAAISHNTGKIQTFDELVLSRKKVSGGVLAVDMESYWITLVAQDMEVTTVVAKVVSDEVPEKRALVLPRIKLANNIRLNRKIVRTGLNNFFKAILDIK